MKLFVFLFWPSLIYFRLLQAQSPAKLSTRPPADPSIGAGASPAAPQSFNPLAPPSNVYALGPEDQISIHVVDAGAKLQITREMRWGMLPLPGAHADSSGAFSTAEALLGPLRPSYRL